MQNADRIYFIDPIQPPTTRLAEGSKVMAFETYNAARAQDFTVGEIKEVTGISFDGMGRAWFVGADLNWYYGALINQPAGIRTLAIGWYEDSELFLFGRRSPYMVEQERLNVFTQTRRSDQRRFGNGNDIDVMKLPFSAKAAPWAGTLFPYSGDTPEMVEAKLTQAKVRWEHRRKHAFIIQEGMQRGWLEYLKEDGVHENHGMPLPRWDVYSEGLVTIHSNTSRTVVRDEALGSLPLGVVQSLAKMAPARQASMVNIRESVQVGYRTTIPSNSEFENRSEVSNAHAIVTNGVREQLDEYDAVVSASLIRPILANLI